MSHDLKAPEKVLFCEAGAHGGSVKRLINLLDNIDTTKFSPAVYTYFKTSKAQELLRHPKCQKVQTLGLSSFPSDDVMVKIGAFPVPTFLGLRYFLGAVKMILTFRPTVIYLNNTPFCHLPMIIAAMIFGKKMICHMRDSITLTKSEQWAVKKISKLVVLSESHKNFYGKQGVSDEKMVVIYNGIDLKKFDEAALKDVVVAQQNNTMLAFVGVLSSRKRQNDALAVLGKLLPEFPDLTVLFIGDGPDRETLEKTIKAQGLEKNALLVGMVPNVAPYLKKCQLGLMLSDREGMPNVILEYMAAAIPVITSDLPGVAEMVPDGKSGIIVPAGDVEKIAEVLRQLLGSKELCVKMGAAGRMALEAGRFSVSRELQEIDNIILGMRLEHG